MVAVEVASIEAGMGECWKIRGMLEDQKYNSINIVSSTKYLGVFIHSKLNFKERILTLENKIARSVGILSKVRYNFPLKTVLQLYHVFIHPLLIYGIVVWGST